MEAQAKNALTGAGRVESLSINGTPVKNIQFGLTGPAGDRHCGFSRSLSKHDGPYLRTSELQRGAKVLNWRTWTGISTEETGEVEKELGLKIPQGCLLENLEISGIPNFSQLPPTSRLVFPTGRTQQLILAVWEENGPCQGVGRRLQEHHGIEGLSARFIAVAQRKRGVMGVVLSAGYAHVGDVIRVYPPAE
jgi:hypothetical protein